MTPVVLALTCIVIGVDTVNNKEEIRRPARAIRVDMPCPECDDGLMRIDLENTTLLACYPPLYRHCCDKCGHSQTYPTTYPHIEYEVI